MDPFGFEQLAAWMTHRVSLPVGPLFCVIDGPTRGRRWLATAARYELRQLAAEAGVRHRFAPPSAAPRPRRRTRARTAQPVRRRCGSVEPARWTARGRVLPGSKRWRSACLDEAGRVPSVTARVTDRGKGKTVSALERRIGGCDPEPVREVVRQVEDDFEWRGSPDRRGDFHRRQLHQTG